MKLYITIETSCDTMTSHFDKDFCPVVEVEYSVAVNTNGDVASMQVISVCEVPPKHMGSMAGHYVSLESIPESDMKWIRACCLRDASDQDFKAMAADAKGDQQLDTAKDA